MQVVVWDTYVKKRDGNVLHFDIIAPERLTSAETIYRYGREYLTACGEAGAMLDVAECRRCHVETPTDEMLAAIARQGYFILDLGEIPAILPANPARRDMILHLRAHFPEYRFADFRERTTEAIQQLLAEHAGIRL